MISYPWPLTVALIGRQESTEVADSIVALAGFFHARDVNVLVETETAIEVGQLLGSDALASAECADFARIGGAAEIAIVVGGDGTLLHAARQLARYDMPLVGINQGRLGFMTDIARSAMIEAMTLLMEGKFTPEDRLLLDTEVVFGGASSELQPMANLAFNDVVIDKGATGRMIEFELRVDDEFIYSARADGLIICTPTGSTAYALSANGPILHPKLGGIALVPLCPHALSNRPITLPDTACIEVRLVQGANARAHFDGQETVDLMPGDGVRLVKSPHKIKLLHPPSYSYFAMLRQKLHWSEGPSIRPGLVVNTPCGKPD
ncbi:MAG: NAD kinase [Fluviibacter phosphoraccumulans EoVTN8]